MSYTPEQIEQLAQLTLDVMTGAVIADRTDPVSGLRELLASGRFFAEANDRYIDSPIIPLIVQRISARSSEEKPSDEPIGIDMSNQEQEYAALVGKIADAIALLGDSDDMVRFKRFLIELAESVVQASGAGLFGSGEKVTREERAFVTRLKEMLGVGSTSE